MLLLSVDCVFWLSYHSWALNACAGYEIVPNDASFIVTCSEVCIFNLLEVTCLISKLDRVKVEVSESSARFRYSLTSGFPNLATMQ